MLQLQYIRENSADVKKRLAKKQFRNPEVVDDILKVDEQKRAIQQELEANLAKGNQLAKQIGELMKSGKKEEVIKKVKEGRLALAKDWKMDCARNP